MKGPNNNLANGRATMQSRCKRVVLPCPIAYFMSCPVWSWTWDTILHRYTLLWQRRNVYLIHGNPRFLGSLATHDCFSLFGPTHKSFHFFHAFLNACTFLTTWTFFLSNRTRLKYICSQCLCAITVIACAHSVCVERPSCGWPNLFLASNYPVVGLVLSPRL